MSGTRSSSGLEVPETWATASRSRYQLACAGLAVLAVLTFAVSGYAYAELETSYAKAAVMFGLVLLGVLVLGVDGRLRTRKPTVATLSNTLASDGKPALRLPYSAVQFAGYLFVMTIIGVGLLAWAVLAALDARTVSVGMALIAVGALIFLSHPALVVAGKFARGQILVTSDGIYQRGWTFESYLPWSSVTVIQPEVLEGPQMRVIANAHDPHWQRRQVTRLWRQDRVPEHPMIRIPAKDIATDPVLVYHLLGFYYLNPDRRAELGTPAAIERARRAEFA